MKTLANLALLSLLAGCGAKHIAPHTPRARRYAPGRYEAGGQPVSEGSAWPDGSRGLFADFRATRVGDLVTIRVDESPNAEGDAGTSLDRSVSREAGVGSLYGLVEAMRRAYPDMDPEELLALTSEQTFEGNGQTSRGSRLRAAIAVRVEQVMPNGDLYLAGTKILMINDEELHLYVSGVIRPEDIEQDNSVRSSLIADGQVEFSGRGALTDNQRQGWLTSILNAINPF